MKSSKGLKGWLKYKGGFTSRHWRTLLEAWTVRCSAAHICFSFPVTYCWNSPSVCQKYESNQRKSFYCITYVIYLATLKIFYSKDFTKVPICLGWGNARVWRFWKIRIHPVFSSFHEISSASDIMLNLSKSQRSIWITYVNCDAMWIMK